MACWFSDIFEESKSRIMRIYITAREKFLVSGGIELWSLLETILRSERSTSELAGPGQKIT